MKSRILIYGGTELSAAESFFIVSLTYALLSRIDAVVVTGGFLYSENLPGAVSTDFCVLQGALKYAAEHKIDVRDCLETWLPDREAENDPQKKKVERFSEGTVKELRGESAQTRRFSMVRGVDALLTVKGKKHTAMILDFALTINKPALPLAFTGGDSRIFYGDHSDRVWEWFGMEADFASLMKTEEIEEWPPSVKTGVINQIIALLERGLEKEASNEAYYQGLQEKLRLEKSAGKKPFAENAGPTETKNALAGPPAKQLRLFLSYSHNDQELKKEFDKQLIALKRSYNVSIWQDKNIGGGSEWDENIKKELATADIILLLISPDFIASDYIWDVELKYAIEKHARGEAKVIPVFLRKTFTKNQPFEKLQGYISKDKPIASFPVPERENAFYEVIEALGRDIEMWLAK